MQICNIRKIRSKAKRVNSSILIHEYFKIKKKPRSILRYGNIRVNKRESLVYSLWDCQNYFEVRIFFYNHRERNIYDLDLQELNISLANNYRFDSCKKADKYISVLEEHKNNAIVREINENLGYLTVFYPIYNREYYITEQPYLELCNKSEQMFIDYLFNMSFFELVHTDMRGL